MTLHPVTGVAPRAVAQAAPAPHDSRRGADAVVRIDSRVTPAISGTSQATYWRRRLTVLASVLTLALLLVALVGRTSAEAELADPVGGHAVVSPGQTLLEIAADTAPAGVGVQDQLARIRTLNGFESAVVDAWTVVLLPAR